MTLRQVHLNNSVLTNINLQRERQPPTKTFPAKRSDFITIICLSYRDVGTVFKVKASTHTTLPTPPPHQQVRATKSPSGTVYLVPGSLRKERPNCSKTNSAEGPRAAAWIHALPSAAHKPSAERKYAFNYFDRSENCGHLLILSERSVVID